jgi:16S rRNA (guanine(1405)-N(7))-methyltransferase
MQEAVERIRESPKYAGLCASTIEDLVRLEAGRGGSKETAARLATPARKRLHRVAAYYLGEADDRESCASLATASDGEELRGVCMRILSSHASSRERIPIMEELYGWVFATTGAPGAIVDLACAYNPLALRWMGMARDTRYLAYDINERTVDIVSAYFRAEGVRGAAELRDVVCTPAKERVDVALLLKMYHCLEHRERGVAWDVVRQTPAAWVVVSFPTRNLANRRVDIAGNYLEDIRSRCAAEEYSIRERAWPGEHVLVIGKGSRR